MSSFLWLVLLTPRVMGRASSAVTPTFPWPSPAIQVKMPHSLRHLQVLVVLLISQSILPLWPWPLVARQWTQLLGTPVNFSLCSGWAFKVIDTPDIHKVVGMPKVHERVCFSLCKLCTDVESRLYFLQSKTADPALKSCVVPQISCLSWKSEALEVWSGECQKGEVAVQIFLQTIFAYSPFVLPRNY